MPAEYFSNSGPRPWQGVPNSGTYMPPMGPPSPAMMPQMMSHTYSSGSHPLPGPANMDAFGSASAPHMDGVVGYSTPDEDMGAPL
jgi:hypothetical protein